MIEIDKLSFGYTKKHMMFKEMDITLEKGRVYGLLGKNGAGKSTLLKNIIGALHPQNGEVRVEGNLAAERTFELLKFLYYLPEQISLPQVKMEGFLKMNSVFYPSFSKDEFYQMVEEFDVPQHLKLTQMSHGQQKKVAIAFGIATNTDWLFLDEPTNGLDIPSKSSFRQIISKYITENRGIVISTHQITDIQNLIENLVVIDNGNVLLNKSIEEISRLYTFKQTNDKAVGEQTHLYKEDFGLGYRAILNNESGQEGSVDVELLFNGLVSKQSQLLK